MSSYARRLVFAAIVSISGVIGSYIWSTSGSRHSRSETGIAVATLESARNEVQRKASRRIIWQHVSEQDDLYSGESIRTGSDSDAKIKFANGTVIELDPESVVVLSAEGERAGLDFIKGNLYVKAATKDSNISLRSGSASIDVSNGDLSLGKSNGGALDVQVLRGSANVDVAGKKTLLDKDKANQIDGMKFNAASLKIKSPQANDRVFVRIDKIQPLSFEWVPVEADYDVKLEIGSRRDSLSPALTASAGGSQGRISALVKPGIFYWRLMAVSKADPKKALTSGVNKIIVIPEASAKPLEPADRAIVVVNTAQKGQVAFRWANPSKLEKQIIEIARDPGFKKMIMVPEVEDQLNFFAELDEAGVYYWRVSGFRQGDSKVQLISSVSQFELRTKFELQPPVLKLPLANAVIPYDQVAGGLFLSWDQVPGVSRFQILVNGEKPVLDKTVADQQQLRITQLPPGAYTWTVNSMDGENRHSAPAASRKFTIAEVPKLLFADGKEQESYRYTTQKPSMKLAWRKVMGAAKYKLSLKSVTGSESLSSETDATEAVKELPMDGSYRVVVEAHDENGKLLARSDTREMSVTMMPLLPPPDYAEATPQSLKASRNGSASLAWKPVSGARNYVIQVKTDKGTLTREEKFAGTAVLLRNLMPGDYQIGLSSMDEYGRIGPVGPVRALKVPDLSDVRAPKFKGIKVQ